jgi:hypothetical protein
MLWLMLELRASRSFLRFPHSLGRVLSDKQVSPVRVRRLIVGPGSATYRRSKNIRECPLTRELELAAA